MGSWATLIPLAPAGAGIHFSEQPRGVAAIQPVTVAPGRHTHVTTRALRGTVEGLLPVYIAPWSREFYHILLARFRRHEQPEAVALSGGTLAAASGSGHQTGWLWEMSGCSPMSHSGLYPYCVGPLGR